MSMSPRIRSGLAALALLAAGCADSSTTAPASASPSGLILTSPPPSPPYDHITTRKADWELVEVCTDAAGTADFHATHQDDVQGLQTLDFSLAASGCRDVALLSNEDGTFTVNETAAPAGYVFSYIEVHKDVTADPATGVSYVGTYYSPAFTFTPPAGNDIGLLIEYFHVARGAGCTATIGFWKTHAGFSSGNQGDEVSPLLPQLLGTAGGAKSVNVAASLTAYEILSMSYAGGQPSNGITKLYAQLLGAKLNIASGADASAVGAVIAAADVFLAGHDQGDWASLSAAQRQQVLDWMTALDDYNNGLTGPGHCD